MSAADTHDTGRSPAAPTQDGPDGRAAAAQTVDVGVRYQPNWALRG